MQNKEEKKSNIKGEINLSPKKFMNKVLAGTATGIIIGLIPNAVLGAILKYFNQYSLAVTISQLAVIFQIATPLIIGGLIALQFNFNPMKMMVVAGSSFIGSGVITFTPDISTAGGYVGAGTGDIINTMITASIAVLLIMLVGDLFGSVSIVLTPIIIGIGSGLIGFYLYPYVTGITSAIGSVINNFTTLQPVIMSILIGCSFAFLIISPISTVAIGVAIQLNGVSAGAAAMGVAATTIVLVVNSWKVNKSGVTIAIALGAMKMMMPNLFRKPIILVPCLVSAIICSIPVALFSVSGTASSAGFGVVGLVGPLASLDAGLNIGLVVLCWLIIPVIAALVTQFICEKVFKLYNREDVFKFLG